MYTLSYCDDVCVFRRFNAYETINEYMFRTWFQINILFPREIKDTLLLKLEIFLFMNFIDSSHIFY